MATPGYTGKMLRVDLTIGRLSMESPDELTLRQYLGGTGIGAKYLYDEVPPNVAWHSPGNRLIMCSGPAGGTNIGGSGNFSVVTKGPMTNGATSSQASGFFGAFLKFSGFDGVIVQGASPKPVYLRIHDGTAELRDAGHLEGKDTWDTDDAIKQELGKKEREASVFCIGPAGEKLVRFAVIAGDHGHVVAHNGVGAVMGSKKLKAVVAERGNRRLAVADKEKLSALSKQLLDEASADRIFSWGTMGDRLRGQARALNASLPVKNYTTNIYAQAADLTSEHILPMFRVKPSPCWACRFSHCHQLELTEGPRTGFVGEEPEYEQAAALGPLIGLTDMIEMVVLSNLVDRLGVDANEAGWLIGWLMECYEKGILSGNELDGLDLTWGNAEAATQLLHKIALRDGVGDLLADGVKAAAERLGEPAKSCAVYTQRGNTPRTHDHRSNWPMLLDTAISDIGVDEDSAIGAKATTVGLPPEADPFTAEVASKIVSGIRGRNAFDDSLGICRFNLLNSGLELKARVVSVITGWDFTEAEARAVGLRIATLMRAFNVRCGLTSALDAPSARYGSAPTGGPYEGLGILPSFKEMVCRFNILMGWEQETGKPLPETLRSVGLDHVVTDIWDR